MGKEYTEEDKRAFKLKDYLNARMSALKAASVNYEGKGVPVAELEHMADSHFKWLFQDQDSMIIGERTDKLTIASNIVLPIPTAKQQKVLEKIAGELKQDVENIKSGVLDFAEKNFNMRKYPENVDSVNVFVKALK
jgi:hypothetical protein